MARTPQLSNTLGDLRNLAAANGWTYQPDEGAGWEGATFTRDGDECTVRVDHRGRTIGGRLGPAVLTARDRSAQVRAYLNSPATLGARRVAEYAARQDQAQRRADAGVLHAAADILASYDVDAERWSTQTWAEAALKFAAQIKDGHIARRPAR